jgi:ribosomal protein S18 acetylase RimI-like enzyme
MTLFQFGQIRPEFAVPVLNERAVRASAGILFAVAMITFMHAFLLGNFQPTRVFVVAFVLEFALRLFAGPQLAPVYRLGQWVVRHQQPEWVGAPQKRFAWGMGLVLGVSMFWLLVVQQVVGRLAVDQAFQGQGLGGALLADALDRSARSEIAAFAMVVDAKDEAAAAFYQHHGFMPLPDSPLTLFLPLATVRRS